MRRRPVLVGLALAAAISLPSLATGLFADDFTMLLLMEHKVPGPDRSFDLYCFCDGTTESLARYVDRGPFPWWSVPHLKLAFLRPLASALLLADHAVFGHEAVGYHLHSLLWYVLFCAAAALVLRRALAPPVLALALVLFALHDSHAMAAGWISNRHSEVAAALSLFGLAAHMRARTERWRAGWPLSLLGYAAGLTAGETALATLGYLVAWELACRTDALRTRLAALAPAGILVAGYLALYKWLGYGSWGSGSYIDPIAEPAAFLRAAPGRVLLLVGGFFGGLPADLVPARPELGAVIVATGFVALVLFGWLLVRAMKRTPPDERRPMAWLVLGAGLALLPTLGGLPGNRLLLLPSLGGVAVVAVVVRDAWGAWRGTWPGRIALALLLLLEVIRPPVNFLGTLAAFRHLGVVGQKVAIEMEMPPEPIADRDMVVLAASDMSVSLYAAPVRVVMTDRRARSWWPLSMAAHDHDVVRTGPHTLELSVVGGRMLERTMETLVRDPRAHPLVAGDVVALDGLTVRVLDATDGGPTRIEARFARPLDEVWLLEWKDGRLRHVTLPPEGQPLHLAREPGPLE